MFIVNDIIAIVNEKVTWNAHPNEKKMKFTLHTISLSIELWRFILPTKHTSSEFLDYLLLWDFDIQRPNEKDVKVELEAWSDD